MIAISGFRGLGEGEFNLIKEVVHRESGIHLSDMKKALVQSRVLKRLRALGMTDFEEYCRYLTDNYDAEIINLINCITTNKTDFFRESRHFDFLKERAFPELERARKRKIRIWSAGCSTGAEPYTIAISICEYFRDREMPDIRVLGTDIDTQVLQKAESGIFSAAELEGVNADLLRRYFRRGTGGNGGLFRIKETARNIVTFRRLNLLDDYYPMRGAFNIIFCRNVIIYFDSESRRKLFNKFDGFLEDDGYLIMGHSETLGGLTSRFSFIGNTIYRKAI